VNTATIRLHQEVGEERCIFPRDADRLKDSSGKLLKSAGGKSLVGAESKGHVGILCVWGNR